MDLSTRVMVAFALSVVLAPSATRVTMEGARQGFPKPTVPEGPVEIRGTVSVANSPTVEARQSGRWVVRLEEQPIVQIATPSVLARHSTYEFRWSQDRVEAYRVLEVTPGGWVYAEPAGGADRRPCWLNPAQAISIARVQP